MLSHFQSSLVNHKGYRRTSPRSWTHSNPCATGRANRLKTGMFGAFVLGGECVPAPVSHLGVRRITENPLTPTDTNIVTKITFRYPCAIVSQGVVPCYHHMVWTL